MPQDYPQLNQQLGVLKSNTLALLYQGLFTGIVRIQAGRQAIGEGDSFRRRMKLALQDVQREAGQAGYSPEQTKNAEFAVVAFLDEAILCSRDPGREQWRKKTLNVELFGEAIAGEVFFDRLAAIMQKTDTPFLVDVLEVYLLCLLLGFEGRYSGPLKAEANLITERLMARVGAYRGDSRLCPPVELPSFSEPTVKTPTHATFLWRVAAVLAIPLIAFAIYNLSLTSQLGQVQNLLSSVAK